MVDVYFNGRSPHTQPIHNGTAIECVFTPPQLGSRSRTAEDMRVDSPLSTYQQALLQHTIKNNYETDHLDNFIKTTNLSFQKSIPTIIPL
jgi:hypothetical protein